MSSRPGTGGRAEATALQASVAERNAADAASQAGVAQLPDGELTAQRDAPLGGQAVPDYSATLEQCTASATALGRSVTFTSEMVATPGTQRMGMRIELLQHIHGQPGYRPVVSPGLGIWRGSDPGVKIYRYVKQITNLAAPAVYRAVVHFHWLGEKGRLIRRAELRTARCVQPLLVAPEQPAR